MIYRSLVAHTVTTPASEVTALVLSGPAGVVTPNYPFNMTVTASAATGQPAVGAAVYLWLRPTTTTTWSLYPDRLITDSNGMVTFTVGEGVETEYEASNQNTVTPS